MTLINIQILENIFINRGGFLRKLVNDEQVLNSSNYVSNYLYQLCSPDDKEIIDALDSLEFADEVQSRIPKGKKDE